MSLDPSRRASPPHSSGTPAVDLSVSWVQRRLNALGYGPLVEDGAWGPQTRAALGRFAQALGVDPSTGLHNGQIYDAISVTPGRVIVTEPFERSLAPSGALAVAGTIGKLAIGGAFLFGVGLWLTYRKPSSKRSFRGLGEGFYRPKHKGGEARLTRSTLKAAEAAMREGDRQTAKELIADYRELRRNGAPEPFHMADEKVDRLHTKVQPWKFAGLSGGETSKKAQRVARVLADMHGDDEWVRPDVIARLSDGWVDANDERNSQEIADELASQSLTWESLVGE